MPEEANKLIMENINKNQVDLDEYPAATIIHNRCISMCMLISFHSEAFFNNTIDSGRFVEGA
jgi:glutamate/tyrosine decarboxylase-like PLP-dependent enzyme